MSVLQSFIDGVRTTRDGAILEVTLDRPKANAIDLAASRRLNAIFTAFRDDPQLRFAIVTGTGEKFFSPVITTCFALTAFLEKRVSPLSPVPSRTPPSRSVRG